MGQPKVWVIKEQSRRRDVGSAVMDYTPAMEFGELRFITEFDLPLHPRSTIAAEWAKNVNKFMTDFDPSVDSIILTGHTLSIFLIGMIMSIAHPGAPPKVLIWKGDQGRYILFDSANVFNLLQSIESK